MALIPDGGGELRGLAISGSPRVADGLARPDCQREQIARKTPALVAARRNVRVKACSLSRFGGAHGTVTLRHPTGRLGSSGLGGRRFRPPAKNPANQSLGAEFHADVEDGRWFSRELLGDAPRHLTLLHPGGAGDDVNGPELQGTDQFGEAPRTSSWVLGGDCLDDLAE